MLLSKTLVIPAALVATVLYVGDPYAPENARLHPYLPPLPENTDAQLEKLRQVIAQADEKVREQTLWDDFVSHPTTQDLLAWSSSASEHLRGHVSTYREQQQMVQDLRALADGSGAARPE